MLPATYMTSVVPLQPLLVLWKLLHICMRLCVCPWSKPQVTNSYATENAGFGCRSSSPFQEKDGQKAGGNLLKSTVKPFVLWK